MVWVNAAKAVDEWTMAEVVTGKYEEKRQARMKMIEKMRVQGEPSWFWWLGRFWCCGDAANSYTLYEETP